MPIDSSDPLDGSITTEAELDSAFQHLLLSAFENGVDPGGSWVVRNGTSMPDWEINVSELTKRE